MASVSQSGELSKSTALNGHWASRWDEVLPIFTRAVKRGEISDALDFEMRFAQLAGAVYFRVLVMLGPVDEEWLEQLVAEIP